MAWAVTMETLGHVFVRCGTRRAASLHSWKTRTVQLGRWSSSSHAGLSALYVSDADSRHTAPVDLNLGVGARLSSLPALKQNLQWRGLEMDLDRLVEAHRRLLELSAEKEKLEKEKEHVALLMAEIKKAKNRDHEKSKEILIAQGKNIRQRLKKITREWWDAGEEVTRCGLALPNKLHPSTPEEDFKILKQAFTEKESGPSASHVEIAQKFDLIKFSNVGPRSYFLKADLAALELGLGDWASGVLSRLGFAPLACPEMLRTAVVEGCGFDAADPDQVYTLQQRASEKEADALQQWMDRLHLRGSSLLPFAAYLARQSIDPRTLPLKLFSSGRQYSPESPLPGLFGARQTTKIQMLVGCGDDGSSDATFTELSERLWEEYCRLGLPLRLVLLPACRLLSAESLRAEVQAWAPSLQQHVKVASLSLCSDYISRRLMVYQSATEDIGRDTPLLHMAVGESLDTAALLAVLLEHGSISHEGYQLPQLDFLPNFTRKTFGEKT